MSANKGTKPRQSVIKEFRSAADRWVHELDQRTHPFDHPGSHENWDDLQKGLRTDFEGIRLVLVHPTPR